MTEIATRNAYYCGETTTINKYNNIIFNCIWKKT